MRRLIIYKIKINLNKLRKIYYFYIRYSSFERFYLIKKKKKIVVNIKRFNQLVILDLYFLLF